MRILAGAFVLLPCLLNGASAQLPKANIFVGYSYLSAEIPNAGSRQNLNGWEGSLEGKILPFIGLVADGSGHYGTTQFFVCPAPPTPGCSSGVNGNFHTALFGPRVSASFAGVRPFAHVLIGAGVLSGVSSDVSLASAYGGGVDFRLVPFIGWRFQGDYIHTHFSDTSQGHARFSTGIVFRF